jgi:hypothetical protein
MSQVRQKIVSSYSTFLSHQIWNLGEESHSLQHFHLYLQGMTPIYLLKQDNGMCVDKLNQSSEWYLQAQQLYAMMEPKVGNTYKFTMIKTDVKPIAYPAFIRRK